MRDAYASVERFDGTLGRLGGRQGLRCNNTGNGSNNSDNSNNRNNGDNNILTTAVHRPSIRLWLLRVMDSVV